ncbi:MAG: hypothetical protein EYC62_08820 [Alphaproteobacteria bacterium]|nr:MAG: hypothetical protein EYC62_08820 [Alphaproteobacteria bacterium]
MERLNFRVTQAINDNAARKFAAEFDTALITDLGNTEMQSICRSFLDFFQEKVLQVNNFYVVPTEKGTLSNDYAILAGHHHTGKKLVVGSNFTHKSIHQAVEKQSLDLELIPCHAELGYEMDREELIQKLNQLSGRIGTIVLTIGVPAHGKLYDFPIDVVQYFILQQRALGNPIWLHVDAAFGYTEILRRKDQQIRQLMQHADSWTVNPHKWVGPMGLSLVGFKDGKLPKLPDQKYFAGAYTMFGSSQSGYALAAAWHLMKRPGSIYMLEKLSKEVFSNAQKMAEIFTKHGFKLVCPVETRVVAVDLYHPEIRQFDSPLMLGDYLKDSFGMIGVDMDICEINGQHSLRFMMNPAPKKLFYDRLRKMDSILKSLLPGQISENLSYIAPEVPANHPSRPDHIAA